MAPSIDGGDVNVASASKRKRTRSPDSATPPPPVRRRRSPSASHSPERRRREDKQDESSRAGKGKEKDAAAIGSALRDHLAVASSTTRAGGAYIPPARLRALMAEAAASDPGSAEYQRMSWDALKKSITGLINKVAADNIKFVVPELFGGANLIRGRGLFCRAIMRAQGLSLPYTPVFAALVGIINTKLPMIGELLGIRLVSQFRRAFKRNDKPVCYSTILFIAHLVNQRVLHEILALEILLLLLEKPTDDSVELAVGFMREAGAFLAEEAPKASNGVFDRFRAILYEGAISKRVQFMIEVLSQVRRENFKDNPKIAENLDLVEEDDQITHEIGLDSKLNIQEGLNIFKVDPEFLDNEEKYRQIKAEILGENSDSDGDDEADSDEEEDVDEAEEDPLEAAQRKLEIHDRTETNLVNLRRTIYLTIMSSSIFEEAVHKLLKIQMPEGQEIEMCNMIIECCSQERTFNKFYAHIAERFCKLNRMWSGCFEQCFHNYYDTIHRYETNRLRNIGRLFGSLLATDSISWASFEAIHMNEDDTTSSSRIFTKILFQEMQEILGLKELVKRFKMEAMQPHFANIFPLDNPKNTRFSVNFFTSIGLGALTDDMREHLKNAPKIILAQRQAAAAAARAARGSDSDSDTSSSDVSDSSSDVSSSSYVSSSSDDSRSPPPRSKGGDYDRRRRYSDSRSPSPGPLRSRAGAGRGRRSPTYSRSPSPPPRTRRDRSYSHSRSPSPRRGESNGRRRSYSRSPSPPRNGRGKAVSRRYDASPSRSPSPRRPSGGRDDRRRRERSYSYTPSVSRSRSPPPRR
ncbi:pre-mRNA-splicing factor cwc22 [Tilletia horrida]|uniref:Pre-mRNA-splicing factor cwc22 n=1 Tax=Tilletia horrida TaxID=155126 RepID=A0AAN6K023_9BASI|nr:pre-mRNA-splicing factor cwc22 [Tilletia horrida]